MLKQSLRNRFSLVARRVSLGLLLRAHTRRVGSGWLFTEGLFPPTRSSALTINQFQRLDPTGNGPVYDRRFFISTFRDGDSSPKYGGRRHRESPAASRGERSPPPRRREDVRGESILECLDVNIVIHLIEQNPFGAPRVSARIAAFRAAGDEIAVCDAARLECLVGPY